MSAVATQTFPQAVGGLYSETTPKQENRSHIAISLHPGQEVRDFMNQYHLEVDEDATIFERKTVANTRLLILNTTSEAAHEYIARYRGHIVISDVDHMTELDVLEKISHLPPAQPVEDVDLGEHPYAVNQTSDRVHTVRNEHGEIKLQFRM